MEIHKNKINKSIKFSLHKTSSNVALYLVSCFKNKATFII